MSSKTRITALVAAVVLLTAFAPAGAQDTASVTVTASAEIMTPIQLEKFEDLSFGTIVAPRTATNLRMSPQGDTAAADIPAPPDASPADFVVTGDAGMSFSIVLPEQIALAASNLTAPMMVDDFVSSIGNSGTLNSQGFAEFLVGANLHLASGQASGYYTGTFEVSVAYE